MKHVSLSEARANIAGLLDEVERGETVTISRDGVAVSGPQIGVPFDESRRADAIKAIEELQELRKKSGRVTVEEILAWRDEGRRF